MPPHDVASLLPSATSSLMVRLVWTGALLALLWTAVAWCLG
jgi:hypothetical protein